MTYSVSAQNFLLLEKEGTTRRIKFLAGDQIRLKLRSNDTIIDDQISAIFDSTIVFGNVQVPFTDVKKVWIKKKRFTTSALKAIGLEGGAAFFILDAFNRGVNHDKPVFTRAGRQVLAAGVALAAVVHFSERRWFRIQGRNKIRRLDISVN